MTPRRRCSFGLRTLLLIVAIAAAPLAWVGYSLNWIRERHGFLHRGTDGPVEITTLAIRYANNPPRAPGCLWLLGERGVTLIELPPDSKRTGLHGTAQRLFPELHERQGLRE